MKTFIRKMGNSQGLLIPKPLLEQIGVAAGDAVDLKISKKGKLVIVPMSSDRRSVWADECRKLAANGEFGLARHAPRGGRDW